MNQNINSIKSNLIILSILCAVFIPFSIGWYNALTTHCEQKFSDMINIKSSQTEENTNCSEHANFHWLVFYGVNGVIYSLPAIAFAISTNKKR